MYAINYARKMVTVASFLDATTGTISESVVSGDATLVREICTDSEYGPSLADILVSGDAVIWSVNLNPTCYCLLFCILGVGRLDVSLGAGMIMNCLPTVRLHLPLTEMVYI